MPSMSSVKRCLQINRSVARGNQKEPKNRDDIVLDEECLNMSDGSSFLLSDNSAGERILLFSSQRGREATKSHGTFFMDGTFKSCSKQFAQIYTIHTDFESTNSETNVHPVIFALLPDKKKETYIRMFRLIVDLIPDWSPEKINIDFEAASISALREVFPKAEINGCFFHMKKCLWRRVQDLGMTNDYKEDEDLRMHIRMCASLAFVKPEDVAEGFVHIHSSAPNNEKLNKFFDYFVEQWLENREIPTSMWSCYGRRHRTTNAVEGWHNKINRILLNPNPRVKDVVQCLKKEAEFADSMFMRIELGMEGTKRKRKYVNIDERIERVTRRYQETGDILSCLKAMSYHNKIE